MTTKSQALKALIDYTDTTELQVRRIKRACTEELASALQINDRWHGGEIDYDERNVLLKKADSLAFEILAILGYEVDAYFGTTPILREIEDEKKEDE